MAAFCYGGVASTCLLFFVTGHRYLVGGLLLIVANFAFGVTIVLYNAFLNDITTEDRRNKVSSQGYAVGYLGGGLLLATNLGLVSASDRLGLSRELAVRISLLSAGLWWGGFALITFARLRHSSGHTRANRWTDRIWLSGLSNSVGCGPRSSGCAIHGGISSRTWRSTTLSRR